MVMRLDQVVPFGRSFDEYCWMFSLSEQDLQGSILGVADGPASFNAEGTAKGVSIQSCDPLYEFGGAEIRDRFYAVLDDIIGQIESTSDSWVWSYHDSPAALKTHRVAVTEAFYQDYDEGKRAGRYTCAALPTLDYKGDSFDLCLCSHFLFLYSDQLDAAFHFEAIAEMLRISHEVRIFPLLTLDQKKSPHLPAAIRQLEAAGYRCSIEKVDYELQPGGNEMLRIIPTT